MTFDVGQKVVYPNHGVSVVEQISTAEFDGFQQMLYHLRLLSNNSKVMVPKENLELVGLRPLCGKQEIQQLFDILEDGNIDTYKDWKGRYKQNLDKMKTGQLTEVAEVLKNLCLVSQKKSLSFREKKMYERAKYFIVSEVAHVKDLNEKEAETMVEGCLGSSLDKIRKGAERANGKPAKPAAPANGKTAAVAVSNGKPVAAPANGKAVAETKPASKVTKKFRAKPKVEEEPGEDFDALEAFDEEEMEAIAS